jgi:hypothetical protein
LGHHRELVEDTPMVDNLPAGDLEETVFASAHLPTARRAAKKQLGVRPAYCHAGGYAVACAH